MWLNKTKDTQKSAYISLTYYIENKTVTYRGVLESDVMHVLTACSLVSMQFSLHVKRIMKVGPPP